MSSTIPARTSLTSSGGRALRGAAAAIIGLGMLLTSACGSDDSDDSASAADDSSQEQADDQDDAAAEEADDAEDADDAADDGGSASDYCAALEEMGNDFLSGMNAAPGEGDSQFAEQLQGIAAVAPAEIAEDWQALADMYETISDIDLTDPDAVAELDAMGDIDQAGQRIQQHVQDECA